MQSCGDKEEHGVGKNQRIEILQTRWEFGPEPEEGVRAGPARGDSPSET